jgi:hypothetical protein
MAAPSIIAALNRSHVAAARAAIGDNAIAAPTSTVVVKGCPMAVVILPFDIDA